jgi:DTW domain-containing protein YfiP
MCAVEQWSKDPTKCVKCWMSAQHCFCGAVVPVPAITSRYEVVLYCHSTELIKSRASNTGKLLLLSCGARLLVGGVVAHEK